MSAAATRPVFAVVAGAPVPDPAGLSSPVHPLATRSRTTTAIAGRPAPGAVLGLVLADMAAPWHTARTVGYRGGPDHRTVRTRAIVCYGALLTVKWVL